MVENHFRAEIDNHCVGLALNNEQWERTLRTYMRQVFAHERADSLLAYLERTLMCLEGHLMPAVLNLAARQIWHVVQTRMHIRLQHGQARDYYERIQSHFQMIKCACPFRC